MDLSYVNSKVKFSMMSTAEDSLYWACFHGSKHRIFKLANQNNVNYVHSRFGDTPLHQACKQGWLDIVEVLIEKYGCDPNVMTKNDESLLHYACQCDSIDACGNIDVVKYLINKQHLNPLMRDSINQLEPLDYAVSNNQYSIAVYICQHCISSDEMLSPNRIKTTINLLRYITDPWACSNEDPIYPMWKTADGDNILQLVGSSKTCIAHIPSAVVSEILKFNSHNVNHIILYFKPDLMTADGDTILEVVCQSRRVISQISSAVMTKWLSDSTDLMKNSTMSLQGNTANDKHDPSLLTSQLELTKNLNVAKLLIKHGARATPELVLRFEAMEAASKKHDLIELMLTTWNPNDSDSNGYTALHLACKADRPTTVNILLSVAHCDPNIKSSSEEVPLQMITNPEIIKNLIRHGAKTSIMYKSYKKALGTDKPLQHPVKVFIVGNPSVGKSTLTAALKIEKRVIAQMFSSRKVTEVDEKTVGIVPHDVESDTLGRVTLYDFAGHREFYSGHAALLQTAIQSIPPIFILVINLCEDIGEIIKSTLYWLSFLENQCASVSCKPHIILVGSHADALKGVNPKDKIKMITDSLYFINMEYVGFVAMNCQYHKSASMNDLRRLLTKSCEQLRIQEPITFNAHCFLVYLIHTFLELPAVTIKSISEKIDNQQAGVLEFLPKGIEALYKICLELNDRGHILLLKNRIAAENSYVVIDKTFLLSEISGTVFAPEGFAQFTQLSTNSGVVPWSRLADAFPGKDLNVVIGFLNHLEFCHEIVDQALYQLISNEYSQTYNCKERYYLFPGLVSVNAEDSVWKTDSHFEHNFGWILKCINDEQFFSSRFLQVLLLRLAFSFALKVSGSDHTFGIHRKCSIWKNGIFWGRNFNMDVLVEVTDNKSVTLMARFGKSNLLKCLNQRSEVILTISECINQFCPRVETIELFTDSSSALQYPLALNSDKTLCSIRDLSEALVSSCECPSVVLSDSGKSIPAETFLSHEPYNDVEPQLLQVLWDKDNKSKIISDTFLSRFVKKSSKKLNWFVNIFNELANVPSSKNDLFYELMKWRDSKKTYEDFRHKLDQCSIFAGRNILVSIKSL